MNLQRCLTRANHGRIPVAVETDPLLAEQLSQVNFIARQIHGHLPGHVLMEDLVNAGVIGLLDAARKFDRHKRVRFKSYAKFRIRGAILDSLRELDWGPRALRRQARRISEAQRRLSLKLAYTPGEAEVAEELGLRLPEYQDLLCQIYRLEIGSVSHSPLAGEDHDRAEQLPAPASENPYDSCLRSEMREVLSRAMAELPGNERTIVGLYYFAEWTMERIGARLGISESRVSQIHSAAISRLRSRFREFTESAAQPAIHRQEAPARVR